MYPNLSPLSTLLSVSLSLSLSFLLSLPFCWFPLIGQTEKRSTNSQAWSLVGVVRGWGQPPGKERPIENGWEDGKKREQRITNTLSVNIFGTSLGHRTMYENRGN